MKCVVMFTVTSCNCAFKPNTSNFSKCCHMQPIYIYIYYPVSKHCHTHCLRQPTCCRFLKTCMCYVLQFQLRIVVVSCLQQTTLLSSAPQTPTISIQSPLMTCWKQYWGCSLTQGCSPGPGHHKRGTGSNPKQMGW